MSVLKLCQDLLERGEVVTIFPEGKRSRSARFEVDKLTSGVGKIVKSVENCRVLCIYLRSDRQKGYSNYPAKGSRFHLDYRVIKPKTDRRGREAYADLTQQIGSVIHGMEQDYFATQGTHLAAPDDRGFAEESAKETIGTEAL